MKKSIRVQGKLFRITTVQKMVAALNSGTPMWMVADKYTGGSHMKLAYAIKAIAGV